MHKPEEHRRPRAKKVLWVLIGAIGFMLVGAVGGGVVLLSGAYNTSATHQHFFVTHRLFDQGLQLSVRQAARHVVVPRLDAPRMQARGSTCYHRYCEDCHGAPGIPMGPAGRGMLPIPRNLAQAGREWPASWLYHVVSQGVRMTGMPAWQYRLSDESLWSTVAFLKAMPMLTKEGYLAQVNATPAVPCETATEVPGMGTENELATLFRQYACDTCHVIDGVVGPHSSTGPPLKHWSRRGYIAGTLPNTPANLERWIMAPQAVKPRTLMPALDVPPAAAQAMANYLFAQD
jgi:mono/diheme cytochrome c family protein